MYGSLFDRSPIRDARALQRANYLNQIQESVQHEPQQLGEIAPHMLSWIADTSSLRVAWDELARFGGQAPGPDGFRFCDLDNIEVWSLLRRLQMQILDGSYRPGPVRKCPVPKPSGDSERIIHVQNIADRVVQRSLTQMIRPVFEPRFDECSFGFRRSRDRRHALANAESLTLSRNLTCWIADDIRKAFDRVPRSRLLDLLRRELPDDVLDMVGHCIETGQKRGIPQGSSLSPLMLNVYLDHFLDRPWRREHPETPLIRYADDILVLCEDRSSVETAYAALTQRLNSAGLPSKGSSEQSIHNLDARESVDWLGFEVSLGHDRLITRLQERSWRNLQSHLELAHEKPLSAKVANDVVKGWIEQCGPCYPHEHRKAFYQRVGRIARGLGFDELPTQSELQARWQIAYERYERLKVSRQFAVEREQTASEEDYYPDLLSPPFEI